jgi:hypothetical protein
MTAIRQLVSMSEPGHHETTTLRKGHLGSGHWRQKAVDA